MRCAKSQQREFAVLIDEFESLTKPTDGSGQFADLLARFQDIAEAHALERENELSPEEARDLLERFQTLWQPYTLRRLPQ
jgi:hypothetical protein